MMTDKRLDLEYLLQSDIIGKLIPSIGKEQWQPLYVSGDSQPDRFGLFCALLTEAAATQALEHDGWDIMIGEGLPGFSQGWSGGKKQTTYHRFGGSGGVRPLVVYREFHGAYPSYVEVCEEFRHYHNLAEDPNRRVLLDFDRSGYEIEVARIGPKQVDAKLRYLKEFQAGTGLYLGIYIDSVRYSNLSIDDIPKDLHEVVHTEKQLRYLRNVSKTGHFGEKYSTFSRLLVTVVMPPPPQEGAGIWPYEANDQDNEVSFVTGVNDSGYNVEHTSNPAKLGNYFGANPGASHYLTPIYFRKEVLTKYYADPDRYTVSDGNLSCLGLWGCRIDNDHSAHVVVFLGDLGRDLPYEERLHWKQFNVPPEGGVSETNFKRSFLAQWAAPKAPDLVFRQEYAHLSKAWEKSQGWPLFLRAEAGDAHLIETVRVPVTNSQSELDEQILTLTKLVVDSLNEKELASRGGAGAPGDKGITKLEMFLKGTGFAQATSVTQFLRDLQALRSSGSGHRKGERYATIVAALGADLRRKPEIMSRLLEEATAALGALGLHHCPDYRTVGSGG